MSLNIDLTGTIRTRPALETLEWARQAFAKCGIVRLANVTDFDTVGVPVWIAVRPLARSLTVSQGKGISHDLAAVSAAMESIEVFHAESVCVPAVEVGIVDALGDPRFVEVHRLPVRLGAEITRETRIRWIAGKSLSTGRTRYVPAELFDLDFTHFPLDAGVFVRSSNGLASGNSVDEAALHAICELVERDQKSFWLVQQRVCTRPPERRLALRTICDEACLWMLERTEAAGLQVFVWNIATTIPIPAFGCTVVDARSRTLYPQRASGFGCHPLKRIALSRAISEALQSRLTHVTGLRDDVRWSTYRSDLMAEHLSQDEAVMSAGEAVDGLDYDKIKECPVATIQGMMDWTLALLASCDLQEAVIVDLTRDDIGVPVVHATIPDIEYNASKAHWMPGARMQRFVGGLA